MASENDSGPSSLTKLGLAQLTLKKAQAIILEMKVCRENSLALTKIEEAEMWLEKGSKQNG